MRRTLTLLLCLFLAAPVLGADLTSRAMNQWYKDLLQVSNSNSGIDATLRAVSDGEGTDSALSLSSGKAKVTGALSAATGDEVALQLDYTTNKAAGNDTGLQITQTDTVSGGTSYLVNALVATASKFSVTNAGVLTTAGSITATNSTVGGSLGSFQYVVGSINSGITGGSGSAWTQLSIAELLTVAAANTSTTVADLLPAGALIDAVVWRVTTAIPAAGTFSIGDGTTVGRFATGVAVAAGTTGTGVIQWNPANADAAGPVQGAAAKIVITFAGGDPSTNTGRLRLVVFYRLATAPTS